VSSHGVALRHHLSSLALFGLVACHPDPEETGHDTGALAEACQPVIEPVSVDWEPCDVSAGSGDGAAECAWVDMPMFHCEPDDGRSLEVAVKRYRSSQDSPAQVWFLQGGPGGSGLDILQAMGSSLASTGYDFYVIDHRGVGESTRLSCPEQESWNSDEGSAITAQEAIACGAVLEEEWGETLGAITTTESAADVAVLAASTRGEGQAVYLWGGSYGTYIGHRALQIAPDLFDGAVLEGVVPPDFSFHDTALVHEANAQKVLAACAADPGCAARLGDDPWPFTTDLIDRVRAGEHCSALEVELDIRTTLLFVTYYRPWNEILPALLYRLERCSAEDRAAWAVADGVVQGFVGGVVDWPLNWHVKLSELYAPELPSADELDAWASDCHICFPRGGEVLEVREAWPVYQRDGWDRRFADYHGPLLMLQGELDPASPPEKAAQMGDWFTGAHQHYLSFEHSAHNVRGGAPSTSGWDCGSWIYEQFMADPSAALDTTCMGRLEPLDFDGDPSTNEQFLGTSDAWGD
jgi:pimeloyl-ACP methyl ester carboxylesterase